MGRGKCTTRDIAKLAGVSPATVSRVINHRELVDDQTANRVLAAMEQLGYEAKNAHPSEAAEKRVILVNYEQGTNPFYDEVITGIITSANAHGYYIVTNFDSINAASIDNFINLIRKIRASGVITISQVQEDLLQQINDVVPVEQCCEYNPGSRLPYVSIDDYAAAQHAVTHLIASGRNKIAMVNGPLQYKYAKERLRGFQDTMTQAGLFVPSSWIMQVPEVNYDMAFTIVSQLLRSNSRPNAFFAASDVFAAAIINAARKYNIRIPEDVMVIGFDNISICKMTRPTITTIDQPKFQLGYTACEYLIENIHNNGLSARSMILSTDLIIRESAC